MLTLEQARKIAADYLPVHEAMTNRKVEFIGEAMDKEWCFVFGIQTPPQSGEKVTYVDFIIVERTNGKLMVSGVNHIGHDLMQFKKYLEKHAGK